LEEITSPLGQGYYPKDLQAGGTWMGMHQSGWALCLLNGGSVDYLRRLPYRYSRGKIIPHFMESLEIKALRDGDYSGVEPFTLLIARAGELWQWQHDPDQELWQELDPQEAHFFSSTKLYHPNIRAARESRFRGWLKGCEEINSEAVASFHLNPQLSAKEGGLLLGPNFPLQTVSFCQAEVNHKQARFQYRYLFGETQDQRSWTL